MSTNAEQNIINHIGIVLDASSSMSIHKNTVVRVVDDLVKGLAQDSTSMDQETRISVWSFSYHNDIRCMVWDKDVLRLPSIAQYYHPNGMTALRDATRQAIVDLDETPQKYGDHSFLLYVITDGVENNSRIYHSDDQLQKHLGSLADNWTVGAMVPPGPTAVFKTKKLGFASGNIATWDATSAAGVEEAGRTIRATATGYMQTRASGVRSTTNLFTLGGQVDAVQVKRNLKPLKASDYQIVPVVSTADAFDHKVHGKVVEIKKFVDDAYPPYRVGTAYYQLFTHGKRRSEKIGGNKAVAVMDKKTSKVYVGDAARQVIGLPDYDVTVKADSNPDYEIFVQSSSVNRQLPIGTKLLLLTK